MREQTRAPRSSRPGGSRVLGPATRTSAPMRPSSSRFERSTRLRAVYPGSSTRSAATSREIVVQELLEEVDLADLLLCGALQRALDAVAQGVEQGQLDRRAVVAQAGHPGLGNEIKLQHRARSFRGRW